MMETVVIHRRNMKKGDIYIGRPSKWGNPFVIGKHGTREEVIEKFRQHLWQQIKDDKIAIEDLATLHGKRLACYCAPLPCHGDVLAKAAAWAHDLVEKDMQ